MAVYKNRMNFMQGNADFFLYGEKKLPKIRPIQIVINNSNCN